MSDQIVATKTPLNKDSENDLIKAMEQDRISAQQPTDSFEPPTVVNNASVQQEVSNLSDAETKALEQGWRPLDEYTGPKNEWVSAEVFLGRGTFIKQIKELKEVVNKYADNYSKLEKVTYDRARRELELELKDAKANSDFEKYEQVKREIDDLKPNNSKEPAADNQELQTFVKNNPWFINPSTEEEYELSAIAKAADEFYTKKNPGASFTDTIKYVESKVAAKKSSLLHNSNRDIIPASLPNRGASTGISKPTNTSSNPYAHPEWGNLSAEQKEFAKQLTHPKFGAAGYKEDIKKGVDKYIEDLKKYGAL